MSVEVKLDNIGEGIESAEILEVFVEEGQSVGNGDLLFELETDKATVPVMSKDAGTIEKIFVAVGETVKIGTVLATMDGAAAEAAPEPATPQPAAAEPQPVEETPKPSEPAPEPPVEPVSNTTPSTPPATPAPAQPIAQIEAAPAPVDEGNRNIIPAGPAVRRFAREVGIDLNNVRGSGPSGRITRDDVLEAVRQLSNGKTAASATPAPAPAPTAGDQVEKMTRIRKTIAAQMHKSWSTVPRVTNFDDADVTDLETFRQSSKADYAEKGIKLTSMPFVIKAVATALKNHPAINATIDEANEQIVYKEAVNIGIAVDSDRGLVVPVLNGADQLNIPDIARNLQGMAEKVRENKISLGDLQGSTFTISNLGAIGGTYSTPIVNVPEVAILLIGRSRKMPVVVNDEIVIRLMMPLSLSYDHRLVDGATAARFLNEVIGYLEAPSRLLLAI